MSFFTPPAFGFGKSPKDTVQNRVTYQATSEGRRQVEDFLIDGVPAQILSCIVEREGSCTRADIEARTHLPSKTIEGEIRNFKNLNWITQRGGQSASLPMGYPVPRR